MSLQRQSRAWLSPLCLLICFGLTMSLRFSLLYTDRLFMAVHDLIPHHELISSVQIGLYSGTVLGYVLAALVGLLALKGSTQKIERKLIGETSCPIASRKLALITSGALWVLLTVFFVGITINVFRGFATPIMLIICICLLCLAVAFTDLVILSSMLRSSVTTIALLVTGGFTLGSVIAYSLSLANAWVVVPVYFALIGAVPLVVSWLNQRQVQKSGDLRVRSGIQISSLEALFGAKMHSPRITFALLTLALCALAFISGLASRVNGSEVFGADMRQYLTIFSIVLAAGLMILLTLFKRVKTISQYIMICFVLACLIVIAGLLLAVFAPSVTSAVTALLIFGSFFFALIFARVLLVALAGEVRLSTAAFMLGGGVLLALCQSIQIAGYALGSLKAPALPGVDLGVNGQLLFILYVSALVIVVAASILQLGFSRTHERFVTSQQDDLNHDHVQPQYIPHAVSSDASSELILGAYLEQYECTRRERDIVLLLLADKTRDEIGEELHISPHTVKNHVASIYKKCSCKSKQELIDKLTREAGPLAVQSLRKS